MAEPQHYNSIILGSGQAGTPLASHLKSLGQTVCLIEKSHIAGCCVNEGCTPTKTMVASGRIAYLARRAKDYGVKIEPSKCGELVEIDMQKVRQRKRDIVTSFRGGSERRLASAGVDIWMGEARFTGTQEGGKGRKELVFKPNDGAEEKKLTADSVYINTGCRPLRPSIPGLDTVNPSLVLDSTSVQELSSVPAHLVVLGGGYIGLEFAQLFRRLGAQVTVVHRGPRLLSRSDDEEIVDWLADILKEEGVHIHLNAADSKIEKSGVEMEDLAIKVTFDVKNDSEATKSEHVYASHILLATGRVPNTETLDLAAAGVKTTSSGHVKADPELKTNVEGIFVLGDVKGGPAFTHVSYDDFRIIRDNLAATSGKHEGTVRTTTSRALQIPSVVYTDPQLAHIGPKIHSLPPGRYISYSMPGSWIARGLETDETRGMLKAVVDAETDRIVSFTALSPEGGEIMSVVQMAMVGGLGWQVLRDMVFAHPSWSEALNNLWGGDKKEFSVD